MSFSANANSLLVYRDEISRCKRFYAGKNARLDCITTTATQRSILHMHVAVQWIESLDRFLARGLGFPHFPRLFLISSFMCPVASNRTVAIRVMLAGKHISIYFHPIPFPFRRRAAMVREPSSATNRFDAAQRYLRCSTRESKSIRGT